MLLKWLFGLVEDNGDLDCIRQWCLMVCLERVELVLPGESLKLLGSNVGFRSRMGSPTPRVPVGIMNRACSCRQISKPVAACWYCLQTIAAQPVVMLMRMHLRSADTCTFSLPCSVVDATPLSPTSSMVLDAAVCSSSSGCLLLLLLLGPM